jgi:hypothetical protein
LGGEGTAPLDVEGKPYPVYPAPVVEAMFFRQGPEQVCRGFGVRLRYRVRGSCFPAGGKGQEGEEKEYGPHGFSFFSKIHLFLQSGIRGNFRDPSGYALSVKMCIFDP